MSATSVLSLSRMTAPPGTIVKNQDQQASILRMVSIPCSASLRVVLASNLSMYLIPEKDGSSIVLLAYSSIQPKLINSAAAFCAGVAARLHRGGGHLVRGSRPPLLHGPRQ